MWISKWDERLISLSTQHAADNYWSLKNRSQQWKYKTSEVQIIVQMNLFSEESECKANKNIFRRYSNDVATDCLDESFDRLMARERREFIRQICLFLNVTLHFICLSTIEQYVSYYLWRKLFEKKICFAPRKTERRFSMELMINIFHCSMSSNDVIVWIIYSTYIDRRLGRKKKKDQPFLRFWNSFPKRNFIFQIHHRYNGKCE